jgi:hypothetical protein
MSLLGSCGVRAAVVVMRRCPQKHFGGHKAVARPVPIPNTAVKRSLADGSGCIASARVGCRQSFLKAGARFRVSGFFLVSTLQVSPCENRFLPPPF